MAIDINLVQKLREKTGAGMVDVKEALEAAGGDEAKAIEELKKKGAKAAAKRAARVTTEGLVHAYIHTTGKLGAMVALGCETDFVARNEAFKTLANDIAMHITVERPENVEALLAQPFIKDDAVTIGQLIEQNIGTIGEKIEVVGFSVLEIA